MQIKSTFVHKKNLEGFDLKFIGFSREGWGAFICICSIKHQRANANYGFIE